MLSVKDSGPTIGYRASFTDWQVRTVLYSGYFVTCDWHFFGTLLSVGKKNSDPNMLIPLVNLL